MVTYNKNIDIKHNLLDQYFYKKLKQSSSILENYDQVLSAIDYHLLGIDEDVFYVLYKHILITNGNGTIKNMIVEDILSSSTINKIRSRTVGSTFETYLCLKFIVDQLIIRIRGNEKIANLSKSIDILSNMKDNKRYSSIIEKLEALFSINNSVDILKINELDSNQIEEFNNAILKSIKQLIDDIGQVELSNELKGNLLSLITLSDINNIDHLNPFENKNKQIETASGTIENNNLRDIFNRLDEDQKLDITVEDFINQLYDQSYLDNLTQGITNNMDDIDNRNNALESTEDTYDNDFNIQVNFNSNSEKESSITNQYFEDMINSNDPDALLTETSSGSSKKTGFSLYNSNDSNSPDKSLIYNSKSHGNQSLSEEIEGFLRKFDDKGRYLNSSENEANIGSIMKKAFDLLSNLQGKIIIEESSLVKVIDSLNIQSILDSAIKKVDLTNDNISKIGISPNSLNSLTFNQAIDLDKRLSSSELRRFIDKVGRKKTVAKKTQKQVKSHKDKVIDKLILSDDIDYLSEEEILNISIGIFEFEWDFYDRYLNRNVLTYELVSSESKAKGPIVLCYDGSGSMEGNKILETKAHIVAIIEIAKLQKRNLVLIQFSSKDEPLIIKELSPFNVTPYDILEIYDTFIRGGTDFEKPLKKAIEYLKNSSYKEGDILFITDGFCEITPRFIDSFIEEKIKNKFKLYSIIIQGQTYHDYGDLGKLSDEVLEIKKTSDFGWNDKVSEKIFSLI